MTAALRHIPAVDRILQEPSLADAIAAHGRGQIVRETRRVLDALRAAVREHGEAALQGCEADRIAARVAAALAGDTPGLRPVLNLTGTLVHTNLGRAVLSRGAVEAAARVAAGASNLEYDIEAGRRGDRDDHVQDLLRELTGAEAATVVNNNAAAVLLVLNTLALGREVPVSRGQLVEIGDAFRIPDIMERSGARLREVGTTNRTHARDFENAIGEHTGLLMEVHTSNYVVQGFTASVPTRTLADIAHAHELPLAVDLGSGTLLDLEHHGLPHEPTVREALARGADLVTFSGDKLLGGPQAGIIVGRADLLARIKRNPLRRALRVDKLRLAALVETLRLYRNPDALVRELPTLRVMLRPLADIQAMGERLLAAVVDRLPDGVEASLAPGNAQPGSGSLPGESLPSVALVLRRGDSGAALQALEAACRRLSPPVIGRIHDGALRLDLRALEDEAALLEALRGLGAQLHAQT